MIKLALNLDAILALRQVAGQAVDMTEWMQGAAKSGVKAFSVRYTTGGWVSEKYLMELKKIAGKIPLLIELAPELEAAKVVAKVSPRMACVTPLKPQQATSAGGLNVDGKEVAGVVDVLKKKGIRVALTLDPNADVIRKGRRLGIHAVNLCAKGLASKSKREEVLEDLNVAGLLVKELHLEAHAGAELDTAAFAAVAAIPGLEVIIAGPAVVARGLESGFGSTITEIREIAEEACAASSAI